ESVVVEGRHQIRARPMIPAPERPPGIPPGCPIRDGAKLGPVEIEPHGKVAPIEKVLGRAPVAGELEHRSLDRMPSDQLGAIRAVLLNDMPSDHQACAGYPGNRVVVPRMLKHVGEVEIHGSPTAGGQSVTRDQSWKRLSSRSPQLSCRFLKSWNATG